MARSSRRDSGLGLEGSDEGERGEISAGSWGWDGDRVRDGDRGLGCGCEVEVEVEVEVGGLFLGSSHVEWFVELGFG